MKKVVIVDYGLGNIFSIKQAIISAGVEPIISSKAEDLSGADGVLLPGMGAFADAMARLKDLNLIEVLRTQANSGKPLLGICLGLQLLFDRGYEFGDHQGLGILPGSVKKFPEASGGVSLRVPFIGWNEISKVSDPSNFLLQNLNGSPKMFFVHSFYVEPNDKACILGMAQYQGFDYPAIIQYKNISGFQGHPEKSGPAGIQMYKNWLNSL